jgi:hypothetical protein
MVILRGLEPYNHLTIKLVRGEPRRSYLLQSPKLIGISGGVPKKWCSRKQNNKNGEGQCRDFQKLPSMSWDSFLIFWKFEFGTDDTLPVVKKCRQSGPAVTAGTPAIIITKLNVAIDGDDSPHL